MSNPKLLDADANMDESALALAAVAELEARTRRRRPGDDPAWWPSIEIAVRFGIRPHGSADSRKRGVRLLMARIAETRSDLIASFHGYALATEPGDLTSYQTFRRRMGLAHLAAASHQRHSEAQADADGQYRLPL